MVCLHVLRPTKEAHSIPYLWLESVFSFLTTVILIKLIQLAPYIPSQCLSEITHKFDDINIKRCNDSSFAYTCLLCFQPLVYKYELNIVCLIIYLLTFCLKLLHSYEKETSLLPLP